MPKVKVEILVRALEATDPEGGQRYDILTIQPAGHGWGNGDLTGRFVFCAELDTSCGSDFMIKKRCAGCEELAEIIWNEDPPELGTKGCRNQTCEVQKLLAAKVEYEFIAPTSKGISYDSGKPEEVELDMINYKETFIHKFKAKIDYSNFLSLSPTTINTVEAEIGEDLISSSVRDARLLAARKSQNAIQITDITIK